MAHHLAQPLSQTEAKLTTKWTTKWRIEISTTPTKPGIWRRKDGGYLARVQVRCPKTGKMRDLKATCDDVDAALAWQSKARKEVLATAMGEDRDQAQGATTSPKAERMRFYEYSASWMEGRVARGEIRSEATKQVYGHLLRVHLIPAFGDTYLDALTAADIKSYREGLARVVGVGR